MLTLRHFSPGTPFHRSAKMKTVCWLPFLTGATRCLLPLKWLEPEQGAKARTSVRALLYHNSPLLRQQ